MSEQTQTALTKPMKTNESGMLDLFDPPTFQAAYQMSTMMSKAVGFMPAELINNPGACMGALCLSHSWGMNPFMVGQCLASVHGKLMPEGKLIHAAIDNSPMLDSRLKFDFYGDWSKVQGNFRMIESKGKTDESGRAKTFPAPAWRDEDEKGCGVKITGNIKGEKEPAVLNVDLRACHPRNSTLWATDPQQQIIYAGVRKWARRCLPQIMLGVYSPEEMAETGEVSLTPNGPIQAETVQADDFSDLKEQMAKPKAETKPKPAKTEEPENTGAVTIDAMCEAFDAPGAVVLMFFKAIDPKSGWSVSRSLKDHTAEQRAAIVQNIDKWRESFAKWSAAQEAAAK
jgi:hypothetical protein